MGKPIPTKIKFKDYVKAIKQIASSKFHSFQLVNGKGSARRFELFRNERDKIPDKIWVAHEDKYVWSEDLKKACMNLEITKQEFIDTVSSL